MKHGSLAALQMAHDRSFLRGRPELLRRKWARMAKSPFAFLRGAAPLWAEVLRAHPQWLAGLPGRGPLVGDLHLENFGTFRGPRGMTFQVNDFDEAFVGPWAFDVLRLMTSVVLARPELHATGVEVLALADAVLEGHQLAMTRSRPVRPAGLERLVLAATNAVSKSLAKRLDSKGLLIRDPEKSPEAPKALVRLLPQALEIWREALVSSHRPSEQALEVIDCTRRVAGTGSLGVERLQVLVRGEAQPWFLTLKEVRQSPADERPPSAIRIVELMRGSLREPPVLFGASRLGTMPVLISRTGPGEDKVSVNAYEPRELRATCRYLGALAGDVHARGSGQKVKWSASHRAKLLDGVIHLVGVHHEAFLAFCREV